MRISPARKAAFDALIRIDAGKGTSSELLPEVEEKLSPADQSLCHRIVLGTLRNRLYLDHIIDHLTNGKRLDDEVRCSLRIGIYQLLYLDRVPKHAAINESVELVHIAGKTSAKSLVNAVLRRASKGLSDKGLEGTSFDSLSVKLSHPQWLLERWSERFGHERAIAIANADNQEKHTTFRLVEPMAKSVFDEDDVRPCAYAPNAFNVIRMTDNIRSLYAQGKIVFQEEASQLVGTAVRIARDGCFLDVCAAPGSKTTQIASLNSGNGIFIVAGDRPKDRIATLAGTVRSSGLGNIAIVRYDASRGLPFAGNSFDSVLVDAPCTGTGTIGTNPEIRYRIKERDIFRLQEEQRSILENASKLVKFGGRLYYSTCSLEAEENEDVVSGFLAGNNDFVLINDALPQKFSTKSGLFRTFPDIHGIDGFFLAGMTRCK